MESPGSFVGHMLIAMPTLADPNFWRTVVLIGVHSPEEGAFGLVINRPLDVRLADVLREIGEEATPARLPEVLGGGPVEPTHGFVLYEQDDTVADDHALHICDDMSVSGSTDTLAGLVQSESEKRFYLLLGYSGWAPGQLEQEIEENSWLLAPIDRSIIFDTPAQDRWTAALASIGVDPGALVDMGSSTPS